MPESAFSKIGFSAYKESSQDCVLKDVPVAAQAEPAGELSAAGEMTSGISAENFSQLVGALYVAATDVDAWKDFLELFRLQIGGNYGSLIVRDTLGDHIGWVISAANTRRTLLQHDPYGYCSPLRDMPQGTVVTMAEWLPEREWRACRYYTDWCKHVDVFHIIALDIETDDGCCYGLRATRPEHAAPFGPREKALMTLLHPHLKRALKMHLALNRDRQLISLYGRATAQLMVGVVILDQNGMVIETNPAATTILNSGDGLRVKDGALEAAYANDNRKLQRLIRDALIHPQDQIRAMTEGMSVGRQSGQLNWGVVVQNISPDEWTEGKQRPSVAVFVRDTTGRSDPPVKLAQQLFQLTPAETALAIQLANGLSLDEAAQELNIRLNTARAHLRSIFSKTGVRRQTELVRLFLNSVAWLGNH
ncbi:LuxR family transcriptional regulator [Comamonas testosteroni]|uniref:LuxR family transcriptional regulator n=1 Tax=Comamonas testosteroni TaxID=285 RepID=A0A373FJY6_COMTE|nr:helix-turn-helix transcriptional regulator [Comamonas testosteroni]RGE43699.1 LuxR family transcriptional regulator [Comamonas testosteroni]